MAYSPKDIFDDGADAFAHDYPRRSNPYRRGRDPQSTANAQRESDWNAGYDEAQRQAGGPNLGQRRIEAFEARRQIRSNPA